MEPSEIVELVRELSEELMNTGKGDGTIANCYSDEEIIKEFGKLDRAGIIQAVREVEGLHAELFNEILAASGEYDFPEGGQPVRKPW